MTSSLFWKIRKKGSLFPEERECSCTFHDSLVIGCPNVRCYLYENFDAHNLTSFLLSHTHTFIFTYVNICTVTFLYTSFAHPHNSYLHMYLYTFTYFSGLHTYTHKVMHIPISGFFQQSEDQGMPQLYLATDLAQRYLLGEERAKDHLWVGARSGCMLPQAL